MLLPPMKPSCRKPMARGRRSGGKKSASMEYEPGACAEPPAPTSMRLENSWVKFCARPPSAVMLPMAAMPQASTILRE